MFALVAVGAAGVVDGFAAGAYLGTRWARARLKRAVVETEVVVADQVQHVADKVKEVVTPVAAKPSADAFYPPQVLPENPWRDAEPQAVVQLPTTPKKFRASDALAVGEARSEKPSH